MSCSVLLALAGCADMFATGRRPHTTVSRAAPQAATPYTTESAGAAAPGTRSTARSEPVTLASAVVDFSELPLLHEVPIEDPSGHALDGFHAALRRAETGTGQARILFFGASHVASDLYTEVVRKRLQERFGNAGVGFFLPAKPFRGYRNAAIDFEHASGFRGMRVKARAPKNDRYGLAGVYLAAGRKPAASAFTLRAQGAADSFELYYLKQPGGGRLRVSIDGVARTISTRSNVVAGAYERFEVTDGTHRVELGIHGDGPVRIFGMSAERAAPGVLLDTVGIPGARARYHLLWDDGLYREQLARRQPDLVVLAYGTNESGDIDVPIARYEDELRRVLARVHEVAPQASCLLVGPSDRPLKQEDGSFVDRPRTTEIVQAQRRVSAELGCGFFDVVSLMGGPLSMVRWVSALPPLATPDHVHFTRAGYVRMGAVLHDALLQGYQPALPEPPEPSRSDDMASASGATRASALSGAQDDRRSP